MRRPAAIWVLAVLILGCLLSCASISLADADTWTKKADMPTARCYFSASVVNGKIYAIGGVDGGWMGNQELSTVEEYDPAMNSWERKSDMLTARIAFSTSMVDGKIYAVGGFGAGRLSTVEEYDPATDTWTTKASMPTQRSDLSTAAVNGRIYAIGGYNGNWLAIVEEYDPAMDTWTKKANMPTARAALAVAVANGRIYAIGGGNDSGWLSIVEEYDPATNTWASKASMPTARWNFSASMIGGRIFAIGGLGGPIRSPQVFPIVEEYDPETDKWTERADMPTARAYFSTSAVNGKIYAIGGALNDNTSLPTVEEYDTGFAGESVESKGKLATTWGNIRRSNVGIW